jgi:tetratricopeptide (TPR) repeat protein
VAFHGLFVHDQELLGWDDTTNLVDNEGYQGLTTAHLRWMVQRAHLAVYEPLAWFLKAIEHAAFGLSARGFHLVTLALHVLSALLLLDIARRLVRRGWTDARPQQVETAAVSAALLFAVHPLRVEVVAWASGQSYALAGLFFLASLTAYLRYAETERAAWLAAALAAYGAAGLSKSASAMLPVVLVILDVYPLRRPLTRRTILEKLPFFAVLAALVVVATLANEDSDAANVVSLAVDERITRALQALVFYVSKTLWPVGLSPIYAAQPERLAVFSADTLLAAAALAAMVAVAARRRTSWPWLGAALASCFGVLLPVLGLVQHGVPSMAFDRYTYLGTLGLEILGGVAIARIWQLPAARRAVVAGFTLLMVLSAEQVRVWRTTEELWRHALTVTPEAEFILNNLGFDLMRRSRWEEAQPLLARAVALEPRDPKAALNLGVTLDNLGRTDEALGVYTSALGRLPDSAELHLNRGSLLARKRRFGEARADLERAANLKPGWDLPRELLGRVARDERAPASQ